MLRCPFQDCATMAAPSNGPFHNYCHDSQVDLISAERQRAWLSFMVERYPKLTVVPFSSFPHSTAVPNAAEPEADKVCAQASLGALVAHFKVILPQTL